MVVDFGGAAAEAKSLALRIGSDLADGKLGEEFPFLKPALTLQNIRESTETMRTNREEMRALEEGCTYIMACVIVKCKLNPRSRTDPTPLEACVKAVEKVVDRCGRQGDWKGVLKAYSDKSELSGLQERVDSLTADMGCAGIAILEGEVDDMTAHLVRSLRCFSFSRFA